MLSALPQDFCGEEKGKPAARRGRKATGPGLIRDSGVARHVALDQIAAQSVHRHPSLILLPALPAKVAANACTTGITRVTENRVIHQ